MAHHWQAWRQLSQEFGFSLSVDQLLALAGKPSTAIMELLIAEQVGLHCFCKAGCLLVSIGIVSSEPEVFACVLQGLTHIDVAKAVQRKTELYVELAGGFAADEASRELVGFSHDIAQCIGAHVRPHPCFECGAGDTKVISCVMDIAYAAKAKGGCSAPVTTANPVLCCVCSCMLTVACA
jgi:hypothetical protein